MRILMMCMLALLCSVHLNGQSIEKQAKKESKKLEKEGWKTMSSDILIRDQIEKSIILSYSAGEDYFMGNGTAQSEDFGISTKASKAEAQIKLASTLSSAVSSTITRRLANGLDKSEEEFILNATVRVLASIKTDLILQIYRYDDSDRIYYSKCVVKVDKEDFLNRLGEQFGSELSKRLNVDESEVNRIMRSN